MKASKIALAVALAVAVIGTAAPSTAAEVQKKGSEEWPGKFQLGFNPLGTEVMFAGGFGGAYKLGIDFAALVASPGKLSVWVGAGFNYGVFPGLGLGWYGVGDGGVGVSSGAAHDVQFVGFAMLTMEKLVKRIPLVPFVRVGVAGDILVTGGPLGGGAGIRFGGGVHYWLLKSLGLGLETNFLLGGGKNVGPGNFLGQWDMLFGGRYAF